MKGKVWPYKGPENPKLPLNEIGQGRSVASGREKSIIKSPDPILALPHTSYGMWGVELIDKMSQIRITT